MPACLLSLGSNLGDREATLRSALAAIDALPDVRTTRTSKWHRSVPVGGPAGQDEFLNAAVVVETSTPPLRLLSELQDIERRHGRERRLERWAPRPLDIDILLYGTEVSETDMLTLPHPRMAFRRFVLEPAAEVAPRMLHPVIGWPVERLLLHLNAAQDQVAVLSPSPEVRREIVTCLAMRFGAQPIEPPSFPTVEQLWPAELTSWIEVTGPAAASGSSTKKHRGLAYAAAAFPKLTILVDGPRTATTAIPAQWSAIVRRPGRGPMLRLQGADPVQNAVEIAAALEAVWPDLGPSNANRLESK